MADSEGFAEFADVMERIERQNGQRLFYDLFPSADKIRTATTNGIIMLTFTPLGGMSDVVMSFLPEMMAPSADP